MAGRMRALLGTTSYTLAMAGKGIKSGILKAALPGAMVGGRVGIFLGRTAGISYGIGFKSTTAFMNCFRRYENKKPTKSLYEYSIKYKGDFGDVMSCIGGITTLPLSIITSPVMSSWKFCRSIFRTGNVYSLLSKGESLKSAAPELFEESDDINVFSNALFMMKHRRDPSVKVHPDDYSQE